MTDETLPHDELNAISDVVERNRAQRLVADLQAHARAVQAPPDFHTQGMARIRRLPAPRQSRLARCGATIAALPARPFAWVPALTVALLLSLAGNIGLGLYTLSSRGLSGSDAGDSSLTARQLLTDLDLGNSEAVFNAALFQAGMASQTDLGALAAKQPAISGPGLMVGFDTSPRFYLIGALYAEALAYVHSGMRDAAAQHVMSIARQLQQAPLPPELTSYLQNIQAWLQREAFPRATLSEGLALFQPLCEAYASRQGDRHLTLFRMGTWLVNMRLAAVAGDRDLLRQAGKGAYFLRAMTALDAQPIVLEGLQQLHQIIAQPALSDRDVQQVAALVTEIQQQLE